MNSIQYGNRNINYEIKKGNRIKTVAIHINPIGSVTVLSPKSLDLESIQKILYKRGKWIIEKQEQVKKNTDAISVKQFVSGESFPYLGRYYRLKVMQLNGETEDKCRLVGGRLVVEINGKANSKYDKSAIKKALMNWYLQHAEDKIGERVIRIAQLVGKGPVSIKIKNQDKRWGSCSKSGIIRFNWKVIMAPISIMDYVIVHELCHLIHPHHSPQFWRRVQSVIPDYRRKRDLLKTKSLQMNF